VIFRLNDQRFPANRRRRLLPVGDQHLPALFHPAQQGCLTEFDQQIQITIRSLFTAHIRTENAQSDNTVLFGQIFLLSSKNSSYLFDCFLDLRLE
jgi:hypothetical protein